MAEENTTESQQIQENPQQEAAPAAGGEAAAQATAPQTESPAATESAATDAPAVEATESTGRDRGDRGQRGQRGQSRFGQRGSRDRDRRDQEEGGIESSVVRIYRCAKVVKGGRTFSFGALVVVGDRRGSVGIGYGKANEVPPAVEKGTKDARKAMFKVNLKGTTIPHTVKGTSGASTVVLVPARPGTGVTAGKSVRPVLELAGISDILTKAYGSTSPKNLVKATIAALKQLQNREEVEQKRGVSLPSTAGEVLNA